MRLFKGLLLLGAYASIASAAGSGSGSGTSVPAPGGSTDATILEILVGAKSILVAGGIFAAGWGAWKIFVQNDGKTLEWVALIVGSSLVGAYDTIAGFVSGLFTKSS